MEHFGIIVESKPACLGGEQTMHCPGGEEIPLVFRDGCTYAPIRKPTQKELDELPWIMLTAETGWQDLMDTETKEEEFDLDNPTWFTPTADDELETKDWQPAFWEMTHNHTKLWRISSCNAARFRHVPHDYEALRPYFLWKPIEAVKATLENTTQLARNVMRLPLRKHFKSRFPALNVRRLCEMYSTDILYGKMQSIDGIEKAQVFFGVDSGFTHVEKRCKKSDFSSCLLKFIRKHGAMNEL